MVSQDLLYRLRDAINSFPELAGCRIGFQGNHQSRMLSAGNPNSANYRIIILIEETDEDLGLQGNVNQAPIAAPEKVLNKTRLWPELAGAGLLCGAATWSGFGVLGGAAAEPATGGASTIVVVASWTGFATSVPQCANGLVRVGAVLFDWNGNSLQRWDSKGWYTNTMLVIDGLNIISGIVGLAAAAPAIKRLLMLRGALPVEAELIKMTNAQRVLAFKNALERLSKNPQAAKEFETILNSLGKRTAGRMLKGNEYIIRRTLATASRLVSEATFGKLAKAVGNVMAAAESIVASANPTTAVGGASGSVCFLIDHEDKISNIIINVITQF